MSRKSLFILALTLLSVGSFVSTMAQQKKSIFVVSNDMLEEREHPCVVPGKITEEGVDKIARIMYLDSTMTVVHKDGSSSKYPIKDIKNVTTLPAGFYATTSFLPDKYKSFFDFDSRFEYPGEEDADAYVAEDKFQTKNIITITFSNDAIALDGDTSLLGITRGNNSICISSAQEGMEYRITGTSENGCIIFEGDNEAKIVFDNAFITNPDSASVVCRINAPVSITSTPGSRNHLSGIWADGLINVYGEGVLKLTSESDEMTLLRSGENIHIYGGVFDLFSSGTDSKGIHAKNSLTIDGGNIHLITTGASNDQTEESLGELRSYGILANELVTINGGSFFIKTFGIMPEGEKESSGAVGIASLHDMLINGGVFYLACFDDPVNTSHTITMNGGHFVTSSLTDDGFNSNTLKVTGGYIYAYGPDGGFDTKSSNAFTVYGGTLIGIGPKSSKSKTGSSHLPVLYFKEIKGVQKYVRIASQDESLLTEDDNTVLILETPCLVETSIYISSGQLEKNISYYIETSSDNINWTRIAESFTLCK